MAENIQLAERPSSKASHGKEPIDGLAALATINNSGNPYVLTETDPRGYAALGFSFPTRKKWLILASVFIVQLSMNFNAAVYGNAAVGLMKKFDIEIGEIKIGQMIFLVMYAFGCELWAPWSEELGRKWVLQGSLFLVNLWQIPCATATTFNTILAFRALGGLSSAGGSVTLGMVADMWEPEEQQYALLFVVFSSCAGSVLGPIFGCFIEAYASWNWVFWVQLIFGVVAQSIHFFVPETRASVLLDKEAKRLRETDEDANVYGPNEIRGTFFERISFKECCHLMLRPYKFLITEPIVTFLSLLSGFSDALIFTGLDSFPMVLSKWDFTTIQMGQSFWTLMIGYITATFIFIPIYRGHIEALKRDSENGTHLFKPEKRLQALTWIVWLEPVGLFIFAFSALGPAYGVPWIVPQLGVTLIGIANFAIYMATIDYMVAAYGPFAASATGGNGFCRDFLAGIAALYTRPFYHNILTGTDWQLTVPTLILFGVGILLAIPVIVFYVYGRFFRTRSPYAQELEREREEKRPQRKDAIEQSRNGTPVASKQPSRVASRRASIEIIENI